MRDPLIQADVCRRIDAALVSGVHDHLGYEALAKVKLPGQDYLAMLRDLHVHLSPGVYLEIGVRRGDSIKLAGHGTYKIGVDPMPACLPGHGTLLRRITSDQYFGSMAHHDPRFNLALIDGDHNYAQARRDFENLCKRAARGAVIALHDVIPMDAKTSQPEARSSFWTGDVWRLMAEIVASGFHAITVACPPTGLGLVTGDLDRQLTAKASPELDMDWDRLVSALNVKANDWDEVRSFLTQAPQGD